jgi:hypothetical protein
MMKITLISLILVLILAACGGPTVTPVPPSPVSITPGVETPQLPPPVIPTGPHTQLPPNGADPQISINMISPVDEAIVNTSPLEVTGITLPDSAVSVNEEVTVAGPDGLFKASIALEEGPNLIEIIASDAAGNEASLIITVTYEP